MIQVLQEEMGSNQATMLTKKNKNITGPSMMQDQFVMVGICVEALQKKNNLFSWTRSGTRDITAE